MCLPGLFDKDNLAQLAGVPILNLKRDFDTKGIVHASQVNTMAASTTPFKHIDAFVCRPSFNSIEAA
jgi:hypothetical protein